MTNAATPERTLAPGWHTSILRGLVAAEVGALAAAGGLISCAALALSVLFGWGPRVDRVIVPAAILLLLLALGGLLVGALRLARPIANVDRGGSFAATFLGTALLIGTGFLEVAVSLTFAGRIAHAVYALLAVTLLAAGIIAMPRSGRALRDLLTIADTALDQRARRVRLLALVVLAISLLLPFAPMLLRTIIPGVTPRACLVYSGAVGALLAALPFVRLAQLLHSVRHAARDAEKALTRCPACGYPRPPGARCPECGRGTPV